MAKGSGRLQMLEVPIGKVRVMPSFNPRKALGEINVLAGSIRQHGIIEPLVTRKGNKGSYELICGHRRLAAAKKVRAWYTLRTRWPG